ncbi:hypothetical protein [uncultured Cellulomonas sp.]|uniref:hypothetical protein n=1 Tax=uncultured Cellulomonas sp. TaxID=189682 RepID=UPI0028ED5A50|nr:hypothetical protein [uncultured Cellulomonas sp.]
MRARLIVVVAVVLLFLGSTTAYAAWSRGAVVGAGAAVRSGSFAVTATWPTPLNLAAVQPGAKKTGVLEVTRTGHGRWVYSIGVPTGVGGTVRVFPTSSCLGMALTLPWSQTTVQAGTAAAQHCVEFTAATALTSGQPLTVSVPVTGESRSTS